MKTRAFNFPIALLVVMGSFFSSCSKNDNKDDNPDPGGGYDPVLVSGVVEIPGGLAINANSLEVRGGAFSIATPAESGEFSINLNKSTTQLVSAVQTNGNPVFFNVAIDPQSDTDIALNAFTTARSMIFLNPGVVVSEPGLATTIMEIIDDLPETAALAAQLELGLAADPDILVNENPVVHSALKAAINALMQEIEGLSGSGNSKKSSHIDQFRQLKHISTATEPTKSGAAMLSGDPWISPAGEQSGLTVEAIKQSENKYEIRITNSKKRYVNAYLDLSSGENVGSAFLPSRNSVISLQPLAPSTEKISAVLDVEAHPTSILYAYGPGALKHDELVNAPNWEERIIKPVVYTAVYDFIFPLLDVISGVKNFKNPSPSSDPTDVYAFIVKEMTEDLTLRPQIATYLEVGDYSNALMTAIKGAVQICIQNPTLISQYVKGKAAGAVLIPMLAAGLVGPLRAVLIGSSAIDLTSAFYDLATCAMLEKWTISVAQSYDGVWNGTFYYTAEVPQDPPDPPLIVNTSFNLSVTLVSIASIPGFDQVLNITSVICSDPTFGATSSVVPVSPISVAMLPETFGSTSKWGMGFQINFPNGSHIGTNNAIDGSFTVDLYGHYIANSNLVSEEAFSAGLSIYNSNDPGSGPGGYAYNWCTFTGWSFTRQGD
jgi:hypothetical protein